MKVYYNGNIEGTTPNATAIYNGSDNFDVAVHSDLQSYFQGSVDDVRIYNRALTAADVTQLYKQYGDRTDGLVAWWTFDEGAVKSAACGNCVRDPIGNNTGTLVGGPTFVPGKSGKALSFNGTSQYVNSVDKDTLSFGNGTTDYPFSVSSWIKMTSSIAFRAVAKADNTTNGAEWAFGTSLAGYYLTVLYSAGGSGNNIVKLSTVSASSDVGQWIHLVTTYDGSKSGSGINLYRNGTLLAAGTTTTGSYIAMNNTSAPVRMGVAWLNDAGYRSYANGLIDDVRIYNRALSAAEVAALYRAGSGAVMRGPTAIKGVSKIQF